MDVDIVDLVESQQEASGRDVESEDVASGRRTDHSSESTHMAYTSGASMDMVTVSDFPSGASAKKIGIGLPSVSSSEQISSSRVRELLSRGDVRAVARLMGRCYRLVAAVDHAPGGDPRCCTVSAAAAAAAGGSDSARSGSGTGRAEPTPTGDPGFSRYSGGSGVGGRSVAVIPSNTLLNTSPADGLYEASLSAVYRGAPSWDRDACLPLDPLPADLESGSGITLKVRIDSGGVHLSRDALDSAVAMASPAYGGGADSRAVAVYVVIDFWF